jgi:hypothetical protein
VPGRLDLFCAPATVRFPVFEKLISLGSPYALLWKKVSIPHVLRRLNRRNEFKDHICDADQTDDRPKDHAEGVVTQHD